MTTTMATNYLPESFARSSLEGKVAVVTGSTQGLGEATLRLFRDRGCRGLVVTGRNSIRGKRLANQLTSRTCKVIFVEANLESVEEVRKIMRVTDETFGTLDILVNAAATTDRGSLWDTTPEDYDRIMNINTRAPFFLMQDAVRIMEREKVAGSIVNISSTASYGSMPMLAAYGMSKGALNVATKNAAYSLMWSKIRVNALAIGWMDTPGEDAIQRKQHSSSQDNDVDWKQAGEANQPFGRLLQPDEVARCIAFCASEESGMMTGCVIDFDQSVWGAGNAPVPPRKDQWAKAHGMTFSFDAQEALDSKPEKAKAKARSKAKVNSTPPPEEETKIAPVPTSKQDSKADGEDSKPEKIKAKAKAKSKSKATPPPEEEASTVLISKEGSKADTEDSKPEKTKAKSKTKAKAKSTPPPEGEMETAHVPTSKEDSEASASPKTAAPETSPIQVPKGTIAMPTPTPTTPSKSKTPTTRKSPGVKKSKKKTKNEVLSPFSSRRSTKSPKKSLSTSSIPTPALAPFSPYFQSPTSPSEEKTPIRSGSPRNLSDAPEVPFLPTKSDMRITTTLQAELEPESESPVTIQSLPLALLRPKIPFDEPLIAQHESSPPPSPKKNECDEETATKEEAKPTKETNEIDQPRQVEAEEEAETTPSEPPAPREHSNSPIPESPTQMEHSNSPTLRQSNISSSQVSPDAREYRRIRKMQEAGNDDYKPDDYLPGTDPFAGSQKRKERAKKKYGSAGFNDYANANDTHPLSPTMSPKPPMSPKLRPRKSSPTVHRMRKMSDGEEMRQRPDGFLSGCDPYEKVKRRQEERFKQKYVNSNGSSDIRGTRVQEWLGGSGKAQRRSWKVRRVREINKDESKEYP